MPRYNAELLVVINAADEDRADDVAEAVTMMILDFSGDININDTYGRIVSASVESVAQVRNRPNEREVDSV